MDIDPVLPILQKKSFDRTEQDVSELSTWLSGHCAFFTGMPLEIVRVLCRVAGHLFVDEGDHVFKQGQTGDSMYVVVKGYCSIVRQPQTQENDIEHDSSGPPAGSRRGTVEQGVATSSGSQQQPASRRVTMEQQIQQFALATGAVTGGSRRSTVEQHTLQPSPAAAAAAQLLMGTAADQPPGSRRTTATASPSRRATAEALQQQQAAEAIHLGWVGQGEGFGEVALLSPNKLRQVSAVAGDGGAVLLVIDRASWNRLQVQAQTQQGTAAAAIQSVLAASCRPLLAVPPGKRTAEDIETLAELLAGLQAFRLLSMAVRLKLAKTCQASQLPAGAVVFKEDQRGDAMYVVLSGTCHVRARPLKLPKPIPAADALTLPPSAAPASAAAGVCNASSQPGSTVAAAAPVYSSVGSHSSVPRTTWEGAAFTPQEQAKLEAVNAALDADKQKNQQQREPIHAAADSGHRPGSNTVAKDAVYWTAKYMSDAASSATASDPHWGLGGGLTPLAAVFAAKWRQQMRKHQAESQVQQQQDEETAAEDRAFKAMEDLLGKAAARAWKAARDSSSNSSSQQNPAAVIAGAEPRRLSALTSIKEHGPGNAEGRQVESVQSSASSSSIAESAIDTLAQQESNRTSVGNSPAASSASTPRNSGHAAAAAAAGLLAAAAQASDPAESLKLQFAAIGVQNPAEVSRTLIEEVAARADLDGLLADVAGILERKGLPRRLNKKGSMKITRELNKRMLKGASWKSYGQAGQHQQETSAETATEQSPSAVVAHSPRGRQLQINAAAAGKHASAVDQGNRSARPSYEDDDDATEIATEATGMSLAWQSSYEGSDAASLAWSFDADYDAEGLYDHRGAVGASAEGLHAQHSARFECWGPEQLEGAYGRVIRVLYPGESFGELALLSKNATRTATVVVASSEALAPVSAEATGNNIGQETQEGGTEKGQNKPGVAAGGCSMLIRISRSCYDATIRSLQVAALEDLLGFLSSLAPFKSLSRELLTTLAVFVKPVQLGQGEPLTIAGGRAAGLIVIQEGEVKLLDTPPGALSTDTLSSSTAGATSSPHLPRSRRATADSVALGSQYSSTSGSSLSGSGSTRGWVKRLSVSNPGGSTSISGSSSTAAAEAAAVQSILPVAGAGLSALSLGRLQQSAAALAVLGPGSVLGENVLGYDPDQDPQQAVANAKGYKARQAATALAASLTHQATAVAVRPCKVLLLSAEALKRFGRRVRAPLTQLARDRRDFLEQRRAAVQETKSSLAHMISDMKQQLNLGAAATARAEGISQPSQNSTGIDNLSASRSVGRTVGPVLPGSAAGGRPGGSLHAGSNSSSGRSLQLPGSVSTSSSGVVPNAAMMAMRRTTSQNSRLSSSQWQQQQWQQQAFGELMQPVPAVQHITAVDLARLRQVVPGNQAPCVSELAAAARTFPIGALHATAAPGGSTTEIRESGLSGLIHSSVGTSGTAAPGMFTNSNAISSNKLDKGPGVKGFGKLLVPQDQQHGQKGTSPVPDSPAWSLGADGRIISAGSAAAVAASGAAADRCLDSIGNQSGRR